MAESEDRGIHPEVMRHIVDLHRKHSDLQMQMHDKGQEGDGGADQALMQAVEKLNTNMERLAQVIEAFHKTVTSEPRGKRPGA